MHRGDPVDEGGVNRNRGDNNRRFFTLKVIRDRIRVAVAEAYDDKLGQSEKAVVEAVSNRKADETAVGVSTASPVEAIQSAAGATTRAWALRFGLTVAQTVSPGRSSLRARPGASAPANDSNSSISRSDNAEMSR